MKFRDIGEIFTDRKSLLLLFMACSTAVFVFIWVVGPGNTVRHWIKAAAEHRRNMRQIEWYEKEIAAMDERIDMLETDRDTLEKFAREHFGFAGPDEDVFIVEE